MVPPDPADPADELRALAAAAVPPAPTLGAEGRPVAVGDPIPVVGPDGRRVRWFVPAVVAERLVGYVVVGGDLAVPRWSGLQRAPGRLDDCPAAADWLDPAVIVERATEAAGGRRPSGPPVLSYDGVPDRIAWRVPLEDGGAVLVAGAAAWIDRAR